MNIYRQIHCISILFAIADVVSVPIGSSVSVCDLGTLVVESRVKMEPTGLSVWPTTACISCFYQARGEDSLGLLGFSGVWVSMRALSNLEINSAKMPKKASVLVVLLSSPK